MSDTLDEAAILNRGAPAYMAALVDRAARLLVVQRALRVDFKMWRDGEDASYIGTLEWGCDPAPRVVVHDGRSGDFVCQSLVGECFTIDPSSWDGTLATDELEKFEWEQLARRELRGSMPEAGQSLAALRDRIAKDHAEEAARVEMLRVTDSREKNPGSPGLDLAEMDGRNWRDTLNQRSIEVTRSKGLGVKLNATAQPPQKGLGPAEPDQKAPA